MSEKTELAERSAIVELPLSPETILDRFNAIQKFKESFIDKKTDVLEISGKPYILKAGWRKLAFAFNLSDEIVHEEKEVTEDGRTIWRIWTKVTAPNGRSVVAVGSCSSSERKFTHPEADPYAMSATRSKNRAISDILGLGLVSAEEMESQNEVPAEMKNVTPAQKPEAKTSLKVEPPVSDSLAPFSTFFLGRILPVFKEKHTDFEYELVKEEGLVKQIILSNATEDMLKEIERTLEWTLKKIQEKK